MPSPLCTVSRYKLVNLLLLQNALEHVANILSSPALLFIDQFDATAEHVEVFEDVVLEEGFTLRESLASQAVAIKVQDVENLDCKISSERCNTTYNRAWGSSRRISCLLSQQQLDRAHSLPSAAVLSEPKARYFSSAGSQTIISPSRIMLERQ